MILAKSVRRLARVAQLSITIGMFSLLSCQNQSRESVLENNQTDALPTPTLPYIAVFDEESEQLKAEKNPEFDMTLLTVERITQALHTNYPEIALQVDRISNDTLFAKIADARYLTQQMGSSGAQVYIMEATYAYTELPEIKIVHFDFAEGDHAVPGNYGRNDFEDGHTY